MSEELFNQDEQLSEVLQQISSQLRLSLGNIHSALSRLAPPQARDQDSKTDQDAAVLCQSYYRILRLTNNLADASEPPRPAGTGQANDDIVRLCQEVMDQAEAPARLLGIQLEFRCAKRSHIMAMDGERIRRLLLNLLSNAFKFIGQGEKKVTLELRVERNVVMLALTDTGCGMTPQQLSTAFDRSRQSGQQDPPPHGLGLGLPVCQRIAAEHGGGIALASKPGAGTTVTVSLSNHRLPPRVESPLPVILTGGGFNKTIVELSDALPREAFTQKYLD